MATRISSRNFDTEVKKIINNIIPGCKNIYIRVGYFYFSGFSLIAKSLKDKNIKILVGIESDKKTTDIVKSEKEISEEYLRKFSEIVDKDEILDKPEERDSYFIFKKKLKDGTLEVRQIKEQIIQKNLFSNIPIKMQKYLMVQAKLWLDHQT